MLQKDVTFVLPVIRPKCWFVWELLNYNQSYTSFWVLYTYTSALGECPYLSSNSIHKPSLVPRPSFNTPRGKEDLVNIVLLVLISCDNWINYKIYQPQTCLIHLWKSMKCIWCKASSVKELASFPGPAQLSVACSTDRFSILQATESWVGPGNEAIKEQHFGEFQWYSLIGWFGNFPTCTGFPNHKPLSFTHHTFTQAWYPTPSTPMEVNENNCVRLQCLIRAEINCTTFWNFQSNWLIWQLSHLYWDSSSQTTYSSTPWK